MATETTSGYMGLDKAAAELEISPLEVKRLIARERLTATQLGTTGPWRIAGAELGRFIGAGAPDLKMPRISGGWFDSDDTSWAASQFHDRLIKAVTLGLGNTPPTGDGPFEIKSVTPAMRHAMTRPAEKRLTPRQHEPTFIDAFHVWAVERVRFFAKRAIDKPGTDRLATLYASPDDYAQVTTQAVAELLKSNIAFSYTFPGHYKTYRYSVPLSIMLDTARRTQILQAAF